MDLLRFRRIRGSLTAGLILFSCDGIGFSHAQTFGGSVQPIDQELCDDMRHRHVLTGVFPSCGRLRLVRFSYINFRGETRNDGAIVVLDAVANQVLMLFEDLRLAHFPIEKAKLMNTYDGNDDASMSDNNTSSFNGRNIVGSNRISMHAYGAAIDINPRNNPFVVRGGGRKIVKPTSGAGYLDRSARSSGMAELVREIFANHGFTIWGGNWPNPVDYQHFQLSRALAEKLIALPAERAREYFETYVLIYRKCIAEAGEPHSVAAAKCGGKLVN
jgi:hypothetical protein